MHGGHAGVVSRRRRIALAERTLSTKRDFVQKQNPMRYWKPGNLPPKGRYYVQHKARQELLFLCLGIM
jgi:hypothetical protein